MKGRILIALLATVLMLAVASPLNAKPADHNPNAFPGTLTCEDGQEYDFVIPSINGSAAALDPTGHGNLALSRSVYYFGTDEKSAMNAERGVGDLWWEVPGKGFRDRTTWCWWSFEDYETGDEVWIGNDFMFVK